MGGGLAAAWVFACQAGHYANLVLAHRVLAALLSGMRTLDCCSTCESSSQVRECEVSTLAVLHIQRIDLIHAAIKHHQDMLIRRQPILYVFLNR